MKHIMMVVAAFACCAAWSEEVKTLSEADRELLAKDYSSLSAADKARRNEAAKLRFLIEQGGRCVRPGTPEGRILIVNKQKRVSQDDLLKVKSVFAGSLDYDIQISDKDGDAIVVLTVVDDPGAKALVAYPDECRVTVNVAALAEDNPKPAFLAARTRKELLRGFSSVTAGSSYGASLFSKISKTSDLDDLVASDFPLDMVLRITKFLEDAGAKPKEVASYRSLIRLGYDIAPTNAYQKAIYEREKANPRKSKKSKRK